MLRNNFFPLSFLPWFFFQKKKKLRTSIRPYTTTPFDLEPRSFGESAKHCHSTRSALEDHLGGRGPFEKAPSTSSRGCPWEKVFVVRRENEFGTRASKGQGCHSVFTGSLLLAKETDLEGVRKFGCSGDGKESGRRPEALIAWDFRGLLSSRRLLVCLSGPQMLESLTFPIRCDVRVLRKAATKDGLPSRSR